MYNNTEFDRKIREMMENHREIPPEGSWESLLSSLNRRRNRVLYMRRSVYAAAAVAASVLIVMFIGTPVHTSRTLQDTTSGGITAEVAKPDIPAVIEDKGIKEITAVSRKTRKESDRSGNISANLLSEATGDQAQSVKKSTEVLSEGKNGISEIKNEAAEPVKQEISKTDPAAISPGTEKPAGKTASVNPSSRPERSGKVYGIMEEGMGRVRSFFEGRKVTYALSTNYTPSVYSKSVNLLSVSLGYQNDLVPASIREYVQSQSSTDSRYSMPLTFGLQGQLELSRRVALGSGINYSLLVSNYEEVTPTSRLDVQQSLHYLGIPLNIYINLFENSGLKLYVTTGAAIEKGLTASYRIIERGVKRHEANSVPGLQFSMGAGIGAELKLSNDLGLYFDPSLAYFFKGKQPESIRTAQPLQYKFELGMRFNL